MKVLSVHQAAARVTLLCLLTINTPAVLPGVPQAPVKQTVEQEIQKAHIAISRKDYGEAKKVLKRALKLNENSSEACLLMARVYRIEGKDNDAFKYVRKAIASDAGYVQAQTFYARLLFETGKVEQARAQLAIAFAMAPKDPNAYVLSGEVYLLQSKYEEAVVEFEQAIRIAPSGDAGTSATQALVDAIKSYLEFKIAFASRPPGDTEIARPVMKNRPRPDYTEEARRSRTQGLVRLILLVNEAGDVADQIVISGLPHGLTLEAIKAARRIKFSPALRSGKPVRHWQMIEVEFNLK